MGDDSKRTVVQIATDPKLSPQQKVDELVNANVEDKLSTLLESCWHCKRPREEHANGQCLFQSTYYANYGRMFKMLSDAWLMDNAMKIPSIPRKS